MMIESNIYGYVNGQPTYSRDEFVYKARHMGSIEDDAELIAYAEKVTWNWFNAGHSHSFTSFCLSDYALSEPRRSLTEKEFDRLKELQRRAQEKEQEAERARQWKHIGTYHYADNSVEEEFQDKDGNLKTVITVTPHGDIC